MATTTKTTVAVPTYGSPVTNSSGTVIGTAKFNPNTGAALTPTTSGGSSSSNINNYNPNTGALLKPGETVTNKATGQIVTQGTEFKPTPVVSGSTASNQINNQIVPAMNDAKNAIATQALTKAEQKKANIKLQESLNATFAGSPGYETLIPDGIVGPKTKAAMAYKVPEKVKEPTAEDKIASELTPGSIYIYDQKTGAEKQIPATEPLPLGYSKTKPIIPVKSEEVQLFSGDKVVKMSDGTYKLFDMAGNELGASSETTYTQGKQANDVLTNLNNAMNGNYPLKPEQEAQIQGIQNGYQQLIKQQQIDNANATGGMTVAMNRYGLGDQIIGQGNITGVINAGAQEVANLNTKMASAVAEMTSAFKTDNLDALTKSYTAFKDSQDSLQANIDKMQAATAAVLKAQTDAITKRQEDLTKTITDTQKSLREAGVPSEVVASLSDSTSEKDMYERMGNYAPSAPGIIGEYAAYKNEAIAKGVVPMDFNSYQNVDANRKKSIAAAGVAGTITLDENGNVIATGNLSTLDINRFNLAATRATKTFRESMVFKTAQNAEFYLSKIKAANDNVGSIGDQEILDSISQFNTGGGRVTESQVNIILKGKSFTDSVNTWSNKLKKGGLLSDAQRKEALELATATAENFQANYKAKYDNLATNLSKQGIPQEFWGMPTPDQLSAEVSTDLKGQLITQEVNADTSLANFTKAHPEKVADMIKAEESLKTKLGLTEVPASTLIKYFPEFSQ